MTKFASIATALVFALSAVAAEPAYKLQTREVGRVTATMMHDIRCDKLIADEWLLFAPALPETAGQTNVRSQMKPAAKEISDLSPLKRPMLLARVKAIDSNHKHHVRMEVTYEATLHSRRLVAGSRGDVVQVTAPTKAEREAALRSAGDLSFDDKAFREWQKQQRLTRATAESDIEFARRVFTSVRKNFRYEYEPESDRSPKIVCGAGKSDCGGLSNLFVATLRSQGIPARTLSGRWATSADEKEKLGGQPFYQYHVKAEFFVDGVGWVPVDMASAILHDRSEGGLYYFGYDPGDFITQHIDGNIEIDTIHFGREMLPTLQRPAFWVTGQGALEDVKITEGWMVERL